ncbi:MAG: cytochrome c oxidase assembly protein [Rickettsiales bacterium]|nr:cytochrome c oxidase assembly protein [Rickettsiales bacterium]
MTRFFVYSFLIFILCLIATRPYNWFCEFSGKCQKFYLSDLIPDFEGSTPINIVLTAESNNKKLEFIVDGYDTIRTVSGRKNVVNYRVKNLSNDAVKFRPQFHISPDNFEEYVKRIDCLCFEDHIISKGKEMSLQASFKIDSDIESDKSFKEDQKQVISIGYRID